MNKDKYVFAQMTEYLDYPKFRRLVRKYRGDSYVKRFTCWNQLLTLMFGQLSGRESLRDLVAVLEAHQSKCYHLGLGDRPASRNAVSLANQTRDCRIFEEFASFMMEEAGRECAADVFGLGGNVYAFDSTTIPLCLSLFPWARFRRHKGGVKAHVLYDLETHVPSFYHITAASAHDSKAMPTIPHETGSYYVFDRGCNAFAELHRINRLESFFIVRAKQNLKSRCVRWRRRLPKDVLGDAEIVFTEEASFKKNREAPAGEVPRQGAGQGFRLSHECLRTSRPQGGRSLQEQMAGGTILQVAQATPQDQEVLGNDRERRADPGRRGDCRFCLVAIVRKKLGIRRSPYEMFQILSVSLTDKTSVRELFERSELSLPEAQGTPFLPGFFD